MAAIEVVAQHGWGFGAWCWDDWRAVMPADFALHCLDRGYFGPATIDVPSRPQILIVHSLGLHLLTPDLAAGAGAIVVLGGFRHFHPEDERLARRSRHAVEKMALRLGREPRALLADFYARCGMAQARAQDELDIERLYGDLMLLQEHELDMDFLQTGVPVRIIHGAEDRIVPLAKAGQLHELVPGSALTVLPGAGHALPITHIRECWRVVEDDWRARYPASG